MSGKNTMKSVKLHWQLYLLLLLPVTYLVIFNYIPMAGLQLAFKKFYATKGIWGSPWIGLDHFIRFFKSPSFGQIVWNTASIGLFGTIAGFPMPILLAVALNETKHKRLGNTVQMVTYTPYFISTVVMVGIIFQVLDTRVGMFALLGKTFGFEPINLMNKAKYFKTIYILSGIWQYTGYSSILFVAALAGVNQELQEACVIDGSTRFQKVWHVDLPHIKPTIILVLLLNLGRIMNVGFEKVFLMQNPLNSSASEIIATYIYKVGLVSADYSFSTAIGFFNSVINLLMLLMINFAAKKLGETSLW